MAKADPVDVDEESIGVELPAMTADVVSLPLPSPSTLVSDLTADDDAASDQDVPSAVDLEEEFVTEDDAVLMEDELPPSDDVLGDEGGFPIADTDLSAFLAAQDDDAQDVSDQSAAVAAPVPDLLTTLQTHNQAIMASITAFQEAEHLRTVEAIRAEREAAENRVISMLSELDEARAATMAAEDKAAAARADADDAMEQLSVVLDQVRKHAALMDTLRLENDSLSASASAARQEAALVKDQRDADRQELDRLEARAADAEHRLAQSEMTIVEMRAEIESVRRVLSGRGVRPLLSGMTGDDGGAQSTAIFPVQVTAVIDSQLSKNGDDSQDSGVGVVLDVRLIAAIPPDTGRPTHGIETAISLARDLFPTAPLSVVVGEDTEISAFRSQYGDITFVVAPADDSRRKAARVLANAAGHLPRSTE